jgi:hypothetical protein
MRALATCLLVFALGCSVKEIDVPATLGLHRDNNPQAKVPKGALRLASNVVAQRLGMVESRPGFEKSSYSSGTISAKKLLRGVRTGRSYRSTTTAKPRGGTRSPRR